MRFAIDTGALLALASPRDQYHSRAVATATRVRENGGRWISHALVLGELHGHLIRRIEPPRARVTMEQLLSDPMLEWHDATTALISEAIERWVVRFGDQRFSLTDAVTFEIMRREKVRAAFAFDQDFITAGYGLLA
jgi:predicted nucleic acid-binding protein